MPLTTSTEKVPPYTTTTMLDYYTRLDFDYGVSVDHLSCHRFYADKQFRYELTIQNAARLSATSISKRGLHVDPDRCCSGLGSEQAITQGRCGSTSGWVTDTSRVGGPWCGDTRLRSSRSCGCRKVIPQETTLHLFGVARASMHSESLRRSASTPSTVLHACVRHGWAVHNNYLTVDGREFAAIRIPRQTPASAPSAIAECRVSLEEVRTA